MLEMIVRRPQVGEREILEEGQLDLVDGLVGDSWKLRSSKRTADGTPHPDMQLNLMNSRVVALVSQDRSRWHLAGDQLYVDLDLSEANLPPGTRLAIGSAVIEVTAEPHTGCSKFVERFGARRDEVRQRERAERSAPARHQRPRRPARRGARRRHDQQTVAEDRDASCSLLILASRCSPCRRPRRRPGR